MNSPFTKAVVFDTKVLRPGNAVYLLHPENGKLNSFTKRKVEVCIIKFVKPEKLGLALLNGGHVEQEVFEVSDFNEGYEIYLVPEWEDVFGEVVYEK